MADKKLFNFDPLEALADIVTGDFLPAPEVKKEASNGNTEHVGGDGKQSGVSGSEDSKGKRERSESDKLSDTFKPAGGSKKEGTSAGEQKQSEAGDKKEGATD